jgi:hypothetical protein
MHPSSNNCHRKQKTLKNLKIKKNQKKKKKKNEKQRSGQCLEIARIDRQADTPLDLIYKIVKNKINV